MFKFRAKSNIVLGVLSIFSFIAFYIVENNKVDVEQEYYKEKLKAAKLSNKAAEAIKEYRLEKGVFIDDVNDPNQTALIGQEYTRITTDRGSIEAKLTSTNPNFAAVIVQFLKDAGVEKDDNVAVAMTASFPAINISTIAALQTLEVNPIIVTSVGSSNWGANDPYFTWLDMERYLVESKIFKHRSIAASIGGGADIGRGLSPEGRGLIIKAIERNKVEFIHEKHLEKSIARRMKLYEKHKGDKPIKVFINIGGGIASLGNTINGKIIPAGLTTFLPEKNFPTRGVMIQMGQNSIPIIHLLNINNLASQYGLPESPEPMPEPGTGEIFVQKKYSMPIISITTFILVVVIVFVYFQDRKHHQLGMDTVPNTKEEDDEEQIPVV